MNDQNKTVIVAIIVCLAIIGVCWMISSTMRSELIEPHGPMTGGIEQMHPSGVANIPWDEIIYVPLCPECEGEKMILVDVPIRTEYTNGTVAYHWLYTCQKAEMNELPE